MRVSLPRLVEGQLADMHGYMHVSMHGLGVERGRVEKERVGVEVERGRGRGLTPPVSVSLSVSCMCTVQYVCVRMYAWVTLLRVSLC